MWKRRGIRTLALILLAIWLISSAFFLVCAEHDCPRENCAICPVLSRYIDMITRIVWIIPAVSVLDWWERQWCGSALSWRACETITPVRWKIKLLC